MVFDKVDKVIENVLRQELINEGTHVEDYRKRAVNALLARGVEEQEAMEWEEWFFKTYFHGMHNKVIRLEEFFASAAAEVSFNEDKTDRLFDILDLVKSNWQKDGFYNISQLNRKNASSYEALNNLFGWMVEQEKENDEAIANSQEGTEIRDGYSVVHVTTFKEAQEIGEYSGLLEDPNSRLCFTDDEKTWNSYLADGANECYVILRDGWKEMNSEDYVYDPKRPFDDYGLSMIFLFIKPNGGIHSSNTRWNHEDGGNYKGDVDKSFSKGDIAKLLGVNFDEVFKPGKGFEEKINLVMQRLANGEKPEDLFEFCNDASDGFLEVTLCGKWNFINPKGELVSPDLWFDGCGYFNEGMAWVGIDEDYNYINQNGEIISPNQWFDDVFHFSNGFGVVVLNGKYNLINKNGEPISKKWFQWCYEFEDGLAKVKNNGKYNFINANGEYLLDQWFDFCDDFYEGLSCVELDEKWNVMDTNGKFISNKWFDYCSNFKNHFAIVRLNKRYNYINVNGEIVSPDLWFDKCYNFNDGLGRVIKNNKDFYIDQNGKLYKEKPQVDESRIMAKIISESIRMTLRKLI